MSRTELEGFNENNLFGEVDRFLDEIAEDSRRYISQTGGRTEPEYHELVHSDWECGRNQDYEAAA